MQISFNQRGQKICIFVKFKAYGPFFFSANSCKNVALYSPPWISYQTFLPQQVKQNVIITNKNGKCELTDELPNDVRIKN